VKLANGKLESRLRIQADNPRESELSNRSKRSGIIKFYKTIVSTKRALGDGDEQKVQLEHSKE